MFWRMKRDYGAVDGVMNSRNDRDLHDTETITMAMPPPPSSANVCDALLAKLDEVMEFLQFSKQHDAEFRGVVTFFFRTATGSNTDIACIRTVDMRRDVTVLTVALSPLDPFASEVAPIHVSLADFLYMYSGEATAGEIASMCMSGRVSVPWSAYSKLKAFAECFDFSSEKWEAYYAVQEAHGGVAPLPTCTKTCCLASTKEEIDANWCLVSDATTTTLRGANGPNPDGDWEIVSDASCFVITKEKREEIKRIIGVPQIDDWLRKIWFKPFIPT